MKQRLAAALVMIAALLVAALGVAAPASAGDAATSATSAEKKAKKAKKQKKKKCKKYKKVKKNKSSSKKQKKKAKKSCKKAKKKLKKANKKVKKQNAQYFDVCKHGCDYNTIQKGVNAAGEWQKKKNGKANPDKVNKTVATVRVQPGTYTEGVLIHGSQKGMNFNGLKIIGVKNNLKPNPNARKVVLQGKNAKTVVKNTPGWVQGDPTKIAANNAIEARNVDDIVFKNMWAKNYLNNTFFVWASNIEADNEHCADFVMDNLVSSDTKSYGLFSRNCYGGKFVNSEGWNHGDSALYIGETPCDEFDWTNKGPNPGPCQADPNWTIVKNFTSHQNSLGYSGTNSKYVKIMDSTWYNNGAGIVPNTLDSEKFEPSGQLVLENNDIFWNNYNYYSDGSTFETVIGNGNPIGIGIMLYGTDGVVSKNNNIFGNEQWGAATFSGPELFGVNDGDDAKNMNNQFMDNQMGRGGVDPNGNYDFFTDASGGGNCWSGNSSSSFAPGNGSVPVSTIYPACPQTPVIWDDVPSVNFGAGLQVDTTIPNFADEPWRNLTTIFGLAEVRPSSLQECSWNITSPHPAYTDADGVTYKEERALPVGDQACQQLADRP